MLVTLAVSSLGSVLTATILGRRLQKIVADAVKQVEQDANERLAQELALQSYYSGGTRLHRRNADDLMLGSGKAIASEIGGCFEGIREVGRGIVYFGSARFEPGTPLYEKAKDLARRLAATLQCPSWSGGGKGIMGAVTHGAIHGCVRRQLVMVVLSFVTPSVVLQSSLKILSNPHNSRKHFRLLCTV